MPSAKKIIIELFATADVKIDGERNWDIKVNNEKFYSRVMREGSLGMGESYMDGWWECDQLDECINKVLRADLPSKVRKSIKLLPWYLGQRVLNPQTRSRARKVGEQHYDVGNELYQAMLGERMVYTCAYWKNSSNLNEAQEAKLDLVCRKLKLERGMTVLDIGCGWGSFLKFAAEKYGINGLGVTISKEQTKLARENVDGLPIEIKRQDYRDVTGQFDRVLSLGMFEHVGLKNYRTYMKVTRDRLAENGLALLHTIGGNNNRSVDPWLARYIFPNSMLPSVEQISKAMQGLFVLEDWDNFGTDYDPTLLSWYANFESACPQLKEKYDDRFYRMWKYYLLSVAGASRSRTMQLWQVVMSKHGLLGGYESVR